MDEIVAWIEANVGVSPETQGRIFSTLVAIVLLWIVHQLVLRGLVYRIGDQRNRFRWGKTLGYVVIVIGVLIVGPVWFAGLRSLATYLGLLSAGLAIALKDPITDLVGWAFILLQKPFDVGDRIQIGNYAGDVLDHRMFQFRLMEIGNWVEAEQSTGRILYIPNAMIFTSVLANYTRGYQFIWNEISVLLAFDSDWERAKMLLQNIADEYCAGLNAQAEQEFQQASWRFNIQYGKITPTVYTSVKEKGVQLTIRYLCEPRKRRDSAHAIWESVLRAFAQNPDIKFA